MIISGQMYERLSVATYATHDHEPIRALWNEAFERHLRLANKREPHSRKSLCLPA